MKYTIIKVNDRAIENIENTKKTLKDFEYISNINFFNAYEKNSWDEISYRGIKNDVWNPYDGRTFPALAGELGVWVSNLNIFNYVLENNVDRILVLEDDAILSDKFIDRLNKIFNGLPEDFDFVALSYPKEQNAVTEESDIGLVEIHRSINQYSNAVAMLYSFHGIKKIYKLLKRRGIEYTVDCFIFRLSQEGLLSGYSIKPIEDLMVRHISNKYESLIDPENVRNTDNVL